MIANDPLLLPHILIVISLLAMLTMAAINLHGIRTLSDYKNNRCYPRISVLIPARNEENKIGPCLKSLLGQDYPDFQVIVVNDNSTDRTQEILGTFSGKDVRLKVIQGQPLPEGWLGKHWACHQLYQESDGELLVFTDADTVHTHDTLRCSSAAIDAESLGMLSIIPHHILGSWAEKLTMPIFSLGVLSISPLLKCLRGDKPALHSSSGKLLVFRRSAYEACGGFEAIRQNVVDDLELPQRVMASGFGYRVFDGTDTVSCRMYHNFGEVNEGLTKNTFAVYGYSIPLFIAVWLWILFALLEPIIVLCGQNVFDYPPTLSLGLAAISVLASLLLWFIYYQRFRFPLYMIFFYPVSAVLLAAISASSMILTLSGQATWKDRKMPTRKIY